MDSTTQRAGTGHRQTIPIGPSLVDNLGRRTIDVVPSARGQSSVALPVEVIEAAQGHGHRVRPDR
jgi:hypothetical protein